MKDIAKDKLTKTKIQGSIKTKAISKGTLKASSITNKNNINKTNTKDKSPVTLTVAVLNKVPNISVLLNITI